MIVRVVTVHPSVTVVTADGRDFEVPTASFPTTPTPGQSWALTLVHQPSLAEQHEKLNDLLNPPQT